MTLRFTFFCIGSLLLTSCSSDDLSSYDSIDNPQIELNYPGYFPEVNPLIYQNYPTQYGVELGKKLFNERRLSGDNTISCSTCHIQENVFADHNPRGIGIEDRMGLRNVPPIQNMAFLNVYMWDGAILDLSKQPIIPIVTHEEMDSSIKVGIEKIQDEQSYQELFRNTFGDPEITRNRILNSLAQYMYTLISANSKYDKVMQNKASFTAVETEGKSVFDAKCASCHSGPLFTDESYRNIGFPIHPEPYEEQGRMRVTGNRNDFMKFRAPSLRNIAYTAPYGSFGQFATLRDILDYFDSGVLDADNLDPVLKDNNNRIPLSETEKEALIAYLKTLSDPSFITP